MLYGPLGGGGGGAKLSEDCFCMLYLYKGLQLDKAHPPYAIGQEK